MENIADNKFIFQRKRKLDKQFIFSLENINAIVQIDQQLKICCQLLKTEAESEFTRLIEREQTVEEKIVFHIDGFININAGEPFLENALSFNENLLSFSLIMHGDNIEIEKISQQPLFNFTTNYSPLIGKNNNKLSDYHIGYALYTLYSKSCLSLQDIVEIVGIEGEVQPRYRFLTYRKKFELLNMTNL
jgi:hypothetical protein